MLEKINIVFCFDENLVKQIQVTIASLIDSSQMEDVDIIYDIYCVCTGNIENLETRLNEILIRRNSKSRIIIKKIDNPFKDSYQVRDITTGTYLRLMLPDLLENVSKIIYLDVDVLIRESLKELWNIDMDDFLIAGVKGAVNLSEKWNWNSVRAYWNMLDGMKGKYINAGVTILNLELIRRMNIQKKWKEMAKQKFYYQDQDILNISCRDYMTYIEPKYNFLAYATKDEYKKYVNEKIYSQEQINDALKSPVIIHFAGDKPWNKYETNMGKIWWDYVNGQEDLKELFDEKKAKANHGPSIMQKIIHKIKQFINKEPI